VFMVMRMVVIMAMVMNGTYGAGIAATCCTHRI
jgi:hypothetical protein